jgi:endonuclease III
MRAREVVQRFGGSYARQLGVDLASRKASEIHKWFLAAILFGARISETIAMHAYREFERAGIVMPAGMLDAGWDRLVAILDRGGYARYDFKTATKLLDISRALIERYGGDLNALHRQAKNPADLEQRLKDLGKGIGDVTVSIFLRELRGTWTKAAPALSDTSIAAAKALGFLPEELADGTAALDALMAAWQADGMRKKTFPEFEAALVRYGKALRKGRVPADAGASWAPAPPSDFRP